MRGLTRKITGIITGIDILLSLLPSGAVYAAAADNAETPLNDDNDTSLEDLLNLLNGEDGDNGGSGDNSQYTYDWNINEQVSNVKLDKTEYSTGSEQTFNISYDVAKIPSENCIQAGDKVYIAIVDSSFTKNEFGIYDFSETGMLVKEEVPITELKTGTNTVTLKTSFSEGGTYYLFVGQKDIYINDFAKIPFTVKSPTDQNGTGQNNSGQNNSGQNNSGQNGTGQNGSSQNGTSQNGNTINSKGSVRPQYTVYSASQAANMKIFYTVGDNSSEYQLYIRRGLSTNGYEKDQKYMIAGFMSSQNELKLEPGKEQSVSLNKTAKDFEKRGVYTVVLYNMTTRKEAGQEIFYVVDETYLIQRDSSKMNADGIIPFYCDASLRNFNMDNNETYSFQVSFPLNYKKYLEELKRMYYNKGLDEMIEDGYSDYDSYNNLSGGNPYLNDNYQVYMTVNYTPAGSNESRKLFEKSITGLYKSHTVTLNSEEIRKAIYETGSKDISYAGVVTVVFNNQTSDAGYQDIANEAIIRFSESFKFGVYKTAALKKVSSSPSKVELAYGEIVTVKVNDNLGGNIYADIYKGSKKIRTLKGSCEIQSDGTACGEVDWDLKDGDGKWIKKGKYTAKVYTVNEYTVFNDDGSSVSKKVKSSVKSTTIKVVKPKRKLTLKTSVSGISGGNSVYIEKPVFGVVVKANTGVSVNISVKNSKGVVLRNCSAVCRKGQRSISVNLSGKKLKAGKYTVTVKGQTLDGKKKTAKGTFHVEKMPKSSISNASVNLNGGTGNVSFKISQYADVSVTVKSGSTVKQTVIDHAYSAGNVKASFSYGGYAPGNYSVVIKTKNSGGSKSITKNFTIKAKPVVVAKPAASGLSVRFLAGKDGDMVQGAFYYTGKDAKVVVDIMYNDTEEIVYTYQGKTTKDSGTFTYTWDGFKSNGFRCWTGNYTYRVYLVNSAGMTPYLRQNFTLGKG